MRGAISFGDVYFNNIDNFVVGKGLIKAYLLESEAIYPKVVIDTSIILQIAAIRQQFYEYINQGYNDFANNKLKLVHDWNEYTKDDSFFVSYAYKVLLDSINQRNINLIYEIIKTKLSSDSNLYLKFLR